MDNSKTGKLVNKREMKLQCPKLKRHDEVLTWGSNFPFVFFSFLILWFVAKYNCQPKISVTLKVKEETKKGEESKEGTRRHGEREQTDHTNPKCQIPKFNGYVFHVELEDSWDNTCYLVKIPNS